ncbi:MAG: twin-arginine translocation signal domain-containing protein, partial [Phycisphaeraceae bacterium]
MSDSSPSSSNASRRTFLKTSTATAAAGALSASIASRAHAQSTEEIRIALIGCGGRGTGAAEQALSTSGPIKLVAAADAFGDNLNASIERLARSKPEQVDVPEDRRFVGFDAFKKAIDSDVDVVILATPPGFRPVHFEYAV